MIPDVPRHTPDWARLVSLDFETYYSAEYTLSKLSTSEYIRDPRFKAQMVGIKIGNAKTKIVLAKNIGLELAKINWATHSLLCHNTPFDGFILHHHYGIHPLFYYDSLAMARGLHSNDIGASLHEVSIHYGGQGKIEGSLEETKGVLVWDKAMNAKTGIYCTNDVEEMLRVFKLMLPKMPADEIDLIDLTCRMFCDPVLKVDIPRVEKELARELAHRDDLLSSIVDLDEYDMTKLLKGKEKLLPPKERDTLMVKRIIGSSERFAELIRAEGVEPPLKISPAWMKLDKAARESPEGQDRKYAYAFAKDDLAFINMPDMCDEWGYDLNDPEQVKLMVAKQARLQALVDTRIAVKSTSNITRAERFLTAGANGMPLPIGYAYYRAHTGRFGGNNKMNFQNLKRGGELRLSILAPKGHMIAVADSGQIECVAHDSPVLTRDRGYIRIQDIVLTDLLWDGVEWVSHDGVVCTGFKEVITYDGVTATGNHKVWLDDGTTCTLEEVSQSATGQGLAVGGLRGQAIRFMDSDERANKPNWHDQAQMPMQRMFTAIRSANGGFTARQIYAVQKLWRKAVEKFDGAWAQIRRNPAEMQRPATSKLDDVRSTRNQMQFCFAGRIHALDGGTSAPPGLQERGDRSREQRWALRAGQPSTSNAATECEQSEHNSMGPVRWAASPTHYIYGAASRMWVWLRHHWGFSASRDDGRTDHLQVPQPVQKAFVYDILNAGPRHRFTASDRIVSNCRVNAWLWGQDDLLDAFRSADVWDDKKGLATGENRDAYCQFADQVYGREITKADKLERFVGKVCVLGLGFQMGAPKFQMTLAKGALGGPPVYFELDKCQAIVNTYRQMNAKIVMGWKICDRIIEDMAAGREGEYGPIRWEEGTIWLPNGMALKYPDLRKAIGDKGWPEWTYGSTLKGVPIRKKIYSGLLNENIVQALARIIVMWQMLQSSRKYRVVMTTHDEFASIVKSAQAERCFAHMNKWMKTAPAWCADIPLNSEGGIDVNYSK